MLPPVLVSVSHGAVFRNLAARLVLLQSDPGDSERALLTRRQPQALPLCGAYPSVSLGSIVAMAVSASAATSRLSPACRRLEVKSRAEAVLRAEKSGLY